MYLISWNRHISHIRQTIGLVIIIIAVVIVIVIAVAIYVVVITIITSFTAFHSLTTFLVKWIIIACSFTHACSFYDYRSSTTSSTTFQTSWAARVLFTFVTIFTFIINISSISTAALIADRSGIMAMKR